MISIGIFAILYKSKFRILKFYFCFLKNYLKLSEGFTTNICINTPANYKESNLKLNNIKILFSQDNKMPRLKKQRNQDNFEILPTCSFKGKNFGYWKQVVE